MLYYLMRKNVEVMVIDISISGSISKLGKVDINRLPSPEKIRETYMKDSHISPAHADFIVEFYKRKIDLYEQFAAGKNLKDIKFRIEM